jgi:hypothetical protein
MLHSLELLIEEGTRPWFVRGRSEVLSLSHLKSAQRTCSTRTTSA